MAFDSALPKIAIAGAFQQIAAAVQTARDAQAANDITQEELDAIKALARLTDEEVDNTVSEARLRLGL